jgi:lipopolysaccharide transport system ATP-binding protein
MSSETRDMGGDEMVIAATDLGKYYKVYADPKARLKQALFRGRRRYYKEFWAVRNVSFEVRRGDSLGIIGRNGSGKSTLLQMICGTLSPSEGSLVTKGRVAALLELGSGFNPEFTGLENVYLNASLLGLSKEETDSKIDSILAFADIGDFVKQPVKTYSSGMTVRLAFAVIAHVDADILVIDEALAVGDAIFVQRCMRYIRRMREERCLLFVSHDSEAVRSLCSHALWLSQGTPQAYGKCKDVILDYLQYCQATSYGEEVTVTSLESTRQIEEKETSSDLAVNEDSNPDLSNRRILDYGGIGTQSDNLDKASGWRTGHADLVAVTIRPIRDMGESQILKGGEEVQITVQARANQMLYMPVIGFTLVNRLGQPLLGENTFITREHTTMETVDPGDEMTAIFQLWFPMLPSGEYALMASIADGDESNHIQHHWTEDAVLIRVDSSRVRYGLVGGFISNVDFVIKKHDDAIEFRQID